MESDWTGSQWLPQGDEANSRGESGAFVRWAMLQDTGRAGYVAANPENGGIAAWLNGCDNLGGPPSHRPGAASNGGNTNPCITISGRVRDTLLEGDIATFSAAEGGEHRKAIAGDATEWTVGCNNPISITGNIESESWNYTNSDTNIQRTVRVRNHIFKPTACVKAPIATIYCSLTTFDNFGDCPNAPALP